MKLTLILISLCLIGFFFPIFLTDYNAFVNEFGFSGKNLLAKPWVLITSIFLHANIGHLLSNILILFFFGMAVESELGKKMLLIFFLGAIAGDLLSLLVYPFEAVSIGASAGIFALIGAGILVRPFDFSLYPFIMPIPLAFLGILYAIYNIYGFIVEPASEISYIAHFGGLFVGLYYGFQIVGIKKGVKIILFVLSIMVLIPIIWMMIR